MSNKDHEQQKEELRKMMKKQPSFSFRETADMLKLSPPTISKAVSEDDIRTVNTGGKWDRIPACEVLQYGVRRGKEPEKLGEKVKARTNADDQEIWNWFVIGLGLLAIYEEAKAEEEGRVEEYDPDE